MRRVQSSISSISTVSAQNDVQLSPLPLAGRRRSSFIFRPYLSVAVTSSASSEDLKLQWATQVSRSDGPVITCPNDIDCVFVFENQVNSEQLEQPAHVEGLLQANYEDHQDMSKSCNIQVNEDVSCFAESAKFLFSDEFGRASCLPPFSTDFACLISSFSSAVHSPLGILTAASSESDPSLGRRRSLPVAASATKLLSRNSRKQGSTGLKSVLQQSQAADETPSITANEVTSPLRFRMRRIRRVVRDLNCLGES